jgi:hypothetical protein
VNEIDADGNTMGARSLKISSRVLWFVGALLAMFLVMLTADQALAGKIYRCVEHTTNKVTVSDSPCQYATASRDKTAAADSGKKSADNKDAAKTDGKSSAPLAKKDTKN